jgi:hypothetical protein
MYDTREEAERRLLDTVVGFDGLPVTVTTLRGRGPNAIEVGFVPHPFDGQEQTANLLDPRFNRFQTIPLGFVNYFSREYGFNVSFAQRLPARQQRQGLCNQNFNCSTLKGSVRIPFDVVTKSPAFVEMVANVYPSWSDTLEHIVPGSSIAVSRSFAIAMSESGGLTLFNNHEEVGVIFRNQLYLNNDRQYLMESIIECPNLPDNPEIM